MNQEINMENKQAPELLDVTGMIDNFLKGIYYLRFKFLVLVVACSVLFCGYKRITYKPYYVASSTYTISASVSSDDNTTYIDNATANQMASTFPYILKSGILKTIIAEDLGMQSVPGTIEASVMSDTNMFTLKVTADDPQLASKILASVVKNYPEVAEFVIGSSKLTLMDETGVPTTPGNPFSYKSEFLMGAIIGLAICFVLNILYMVGRNTIKKEEDFKKIFNVKSLGILPRAKFNKRRNEVKELVLLTNPRIPRQFMESIRVIRRRIERAYKHEHVKSFLVTSAMAGEGKSTVSANIALALSMKGYKVILVDGDLRNPSTAKVFGMEEAEVGTLEVLKGEKSIREGIQTYKDTNVKILVGSNPVQDTSTVLSGDNMKSFIRKLEQEADFVIIDTPPSALLSDAAIVAQYVQGAVFVVRQDYTDIDCILDGMEILSGSGVKILGCVLNDVNSMVRNSKGYETAYYRKTESR